MKQLVWALMASATLIWAQEKAAPPKPTGPQKSVVVEVKNGDVNRIQGILFDSLPGVKVRADPTLRVISVSGDAAGVAAIEEAIKKLDIATPPVRNVELTMYLVYAAVMDSPTATVPSDLDATVKQLHVIFPYKSYKVLDTILLRARDGERGSSSGTLPGSRTAYEFSYQRATITSQAPRTVRFDQLQLSLSFEPRASYIQTNLDAREGQKTVVGKANVANTEDAVFLVITPKVVD